MHYSSNFRLLLAGLLCWLNAGALLQAQSLDPSFQPTVLKAPPAVSGLQSGVNVLAVQPNGKVLAAGGFDFANNSLSGKIQRFETSGAPDATFNVGGIGANGFISAVVVQPDGKILVGGGFTTFNGQPMPLVVRLNANGSLDTGFTFATASATRQISSIALQPDGKILVGSGINLATATGPQTGGLVRLLPNGTLDTSFNLGTGINQGLVSAILVQADGNIVIGGGFTTFNGQQLPLVVRLTASGALDPTFIYNTPNTTYQIGGSILALAQQLDGKLLAAGSFGLSITAASLRITRFLLDGTIDNTFQPGTGPNSTVRSMALDASGNILIGGGFTTVNGVARNRVARLTPTGALDASYGDPTGANATVNAVAVTAAGQVLVGGVFTQFSGAASSAVLVRLSAGTGLLDSQFAPVIEARGTLNQVVPLPSGQLLVSGNFTQFNGASAPGSANSVRRLNTDGTLDASFTSPAGASGILQAVQPNGSFYAVSSSTVVKSLGSGALDNSFTAQTFAATTATPAPVLLQGATGLANGQLLVFGRFGSYGALSGLNGLVRLNADGTPDNTFGPAVFSADNRVLQVLIQPGGKLLVVSQNLSTAATAVARLNANGTADNSFSVGTAAGTGASYGVLMQPDGRLLVSGMFTSFNGQPVPYGFTRLTIDGSADPTFFGLGAANYYSPRAVQSDGRLLVTRGGGTLNSGNVLARLNSDGSADASFSLVNIPESIFIGDDVLSGILLQPIDGKIVLYGSFRYIAGQPRIGLARLTNIGLATRAASAIRPLSLYPNPAQTAVTIALPPAPQPRPAALLDLNGRVVRRWTVPAQQAETRLGLEAVAAGVYLLQVRGEDAVYQQKVVVTP